MKILAIDTSSTACSIALSIDNVVTSCHQIAPMQQAQQVLLLIDQLISESGLSLQELDVIAFGCGPGSFTGIRIATSVAQGLSYGLQIPIIPISSLAVLAQAAFQALGWKQLYVAIDARIQEIYCSQYQVNSQGIVELIDQEQVCSPENAPCLSDTNWYAIGNAWEIYSNQMKYQPRDKDSSRLPHAASMIPLAMKLINEGKCLSPAQAAPVYLRNEVAVKSKKS